MVDEPIQGPKAGTLPKGWRMVAFGEVVRQTKVDADPETSGLERYVAGEHMDTDDLHIRRWGTVGDGYLGPAFHRKFLSGQILYGSRRTYLRKVAVAPFDGICANTTFVLEPSGDELLPELLPFIMQTDAFNEHAVKQSRGSVNPYVNFRDIAWYAFPLPPKEEQQRIADLLWAADAAVERWREVWEHVEPLRNAESSRIFRAGAEAPTAVCRDLCEDVTVGIVVRPATFYAAEGIPALRSLNIFPNRFVLDDLVHLSEEGHRLHMKSALRQGDVVVVRTGRPGDAAVIPDAMAGWNCIDAIIVRPGSKLRPQFLAAFLNSSVGHEAVGRGSAGTAQQHFNVSSFNRLDIPYPPLLVQDRAVAALAEIDRAANIVTGHLSKCRSSRNALRVSLLEGSCANV